jgi:hypothetical protein
MPFRAATRTILQLGSELISSDEGGFSELIKNAFDARSKYGVRIDVVVGIPILNIGRSKNIALGIRVAKRGTITKCKTAFALSPSPQVAPST